MFIFLELDEKPKISHYTGSCSESYPIAALYVHMHTCTLSVCYMHCICYVPICTVHRHIYNVPICTVYRHICYMPICTVYRHIIMWLYVLYIDIYIYIYILCAHMHCI